MIWFLQKTYKILVTGYDLQVSFKGLKRCILKCHSKNNTNIFPEIGRTETLTLENASILHKIFNKTDMDFYVLFYIFHTSFN